MTFPNAVRILMECAERDVRGCGMGLRETTDEWRRIVSEAWTVAFRKVYRREPGPNEYFNAGISMPTCEHKR